MGWKWFDKYGTPLFPRDNSPEANRRRIVIDHCKPSKRPRGGYRGKPKKPMVI